MTPTDRAIRIACQGIVLLWIAAFLGWRELAPREVRVPIAATTIEARELPPAAEEPEPPPEIQIAEPQPPAPEPEPIAEAKPEPEPEVEAEPPAEIVEAIPEPPAPALPEPEPPSPAPIAEAPPTPAPIEAPPLAVLAVDEADVALGGTLLTGNAGFPALESRYEGYGSFRQYARAMRRLGAEFVVVNRREIVGTIDPWTLERGTLTNPAVLSPRARDYAGEPALARASRAVRSEHGRRAEVMMLVPRRLDAGLFGGIARALEARGDDPASYRQIRARYERGPAGGLRLRVEAAVRRDGREEPLPLLFDLGRLAGRRA